MNDLYAFKNFRLDVEKRLLFKNDKIVSIKPKTFDTLLALLKSKNETITKDSLITEIWNGDAVSDDSLTQQISQLRKILGETAEEHRFIVTVPGFGYKFVADVREVQSPDGNNKIEPDEQAAENEAVDTDDKKAAVISDAANESDERQNVRRKSNNLVIENKKLLFAAFAAFLIIGLTAVFVWQYYKTVEPTTALGVKRIAVLPFRAEAENDETQALKNGMTDSLVTRFSRIEKLVVLPSSLTAGFENSGKNPADFGRQIGADAVLDGMIRKNGGQIFVNIQLIRTSDGKVVWAESFQTEFTGILDVQSQIAYKIAEALSLELSDEERRALMKRYTTSAEAYRLYLDAQSYSMIRSTGDVRIAAQRNYERAIELDPNFTMAYIGLARLFINEAGTENYRKVKYLAKKALEIDPNLAPGYETLAFAVWRDDWDWQEAERLTRKAMKLNRNFSNSDFTLMSLLYGQGKFDEAFAVLEQIPPNAPFREGYEISLYYFARKYEKAIAFGSVKLAQKPNDIDLLSYMGPALTEAGNYDEAIKATENYIALDSLAFPGSLCYLGYTYAKAGQTVRAKEVLQKILTAETPQKSQTHGGLAMLYGALGEKDKAFEHLEKSIENREWWAFTLKVAPYYDSLREDVRFQKMLEKVNLATE